MKILLFAVVGLCVVHSIVAESDELDGLNEFEKRMLQRLARAKVDQVVQEAEQADYDETAVVLTLEQIENNKAEEANAGVRAESCSNPDGNKENTENNEKTEADENPDAEKKKPELQWSDSKSCCPSGIVKLDLRYNYKEVQQVEGIKLIQQYGASGGLGGWWSPKGNECDAKALLKVNFEKPGECASGCVKKPRCGRTMLKIELTLAPQQYDRWGHMLNIGDSVSNNGWGGDFNNQYCDAELHGYYPYMAAYKSDKCKSYWYDNVFFSQILRRNSKITLYVSNEFIRIKEGNGQERTICSHCLFCLNGQYDSSQNEDIYIGLNRVVQGAYRWGKGVCSATVSWECPCDW